MAGVFHAAVNDWFRNKLRAFDVDNSNRYQKAYEKWLSEESTIAIKHSLGHRDKDYFPEELSVRLLREVLAAVTGVPHIDGLSTPQNFVRRV